MERFAEAYRAEMDWADVLPNVDVIRQFVDDGALAPIGHLPKRMFLINSKSDNVFQNDERQGSNIVVTF